MPKSLDIRHEQADKPKLDEESDCMKGIILKIVSIFFALITILAIACAVTVVGNGFLDLSNIARVVCVVVALISGILAIVIWNSSKPKA